MEVSNLIIANIVTIIVFVASVGYYKNKVDGLIKADDYKDKKLDALHRRLDTHGDDIVKLNTKAELSMTAKDVDEKYVSKELFRQFEKHIDNRFDGLEDGQKKILSYIESISKK